MWERNLIRQNLNDEGHNANFGVLVKVHMILIVWRLPSVAENSKGKDDQKLESKHSVEKFVHNSHNLW